MSRLRFVLLWLAFGMLLHSSLYSEPKEADVQKELEKTRSEIQLLRRELYQLKDEFNTFKRKEPEPTKNPTKSLKNDIPAVSESTVREPKKYAIQSKGLKLQDLEDNEGKRYAIVIGINNYQDTAISDLSKARNDAKIIGKILREQGQFDQVFVMTDDVDPRNDKENLFPTKLNIEEKIDSVLRFSDPNDLFVFYFSGHGISDPDENGYLVTVDTVTDKQFNTSLRIQEIVAKFQSRKIRKSLLVLDACRDVLYASKSSSRNSILEKDYKEAEVAATFYSTKAGYYSYEDDETDYGVFTKYMVMGLEGKADSNGDGIVSFTELEQYVQKGVKEWSTKKNKQQKPFTKIHGEKTGDLALTFSPERDKPSLTDKPIPVPITRGDILFRSTFVPGWGQYYAGEKNKGFIYGGTALALGGWFAYNVSALGQAQSAYSGTAVVPGSELFLPTYLQLQSASGELVAQERVTLLSLGALAGFWLWNIVDAGALVKIPKQDFFGMEMGVRPVTHPIPSANALTNAREEYGSFQFQFRF